MGLAMRECIGRGLLVLVCGFFAPLLLAQGVGALTCARKRQCVFYCACKRGDGQQPLSGEIWAAQYGRCTGGCKYSWYRSPSSIDRSRYLAELRWPAAGLRSSEALWERSDRDNFRVGSGSPHFAAAAGQLFAHSPSAAGAFEQDHNHCTLIPTT